MSTAPRELVAHGVRPAVFIDEQAFLMQTAGGISRYLCVLADEMARTQRAQVYLFGGISANAHLREVTPQPCLRVVHWLRRDHWRINTLLARTSGFWRRRMFTTIRRRHSKVVYHPGFYRLDSWITERADATVVTFHDMIPEWLTAQAPSKRASTLTAEKRTAAVHAQVIVANSHATRADVLKYYPDLRTPIVVTPLASRLDLIASSLGAAPAPTFPKRYFLMVGNRHGYKNGISVLRAFASLAGKSDVELVAFGGEPLSTTEASALQENQAAKRWSQISGNDHLLAASYRNAVALVYPSLYEGFGLPVLEAMQMGCPVITTPHNSLREVGGDAPIYVNSNNLPALEEAMFRLLESPECRRDMITRGHRQSASFSWEETARLTLEAYQLSLDRQNRRGDS